MSYPTELLAPAGSFDAAMKAIQAGATALYLGLQTFSARKAARNFDMMQLRRVLTESRRTGVKIYLTINTVILEKESAEAVRIVLEAERLGVDAIIVQDVGFATLVRAACPTLAIHASTQMSVHNIDGAKMMSSLGISRAVLARELTPAQVGLIHNAVPELELEVFIHGALCYSFSGVCFASGMEAGRSANRGECAQFCRSRYDMESKKEGFYFSCSDLVLHEDIFRYIEAGALSLKIEGRMKSPSYVYHTTKLYRSILEGNESEQLKQNSAIVFARQQARPYLKTNRGDHLIDSLHPGHRGVFLGKIERITDDGALIRPSHTISLHDGIIFHIDSDPMHPFRGAILSIKEHGRSTRFSKAGREVAIVTKQLPKVGDKIFLVSSRNLDVPLPKEGSIPPIKRGVEVVAVLSESVIELRSADFVYRSELLPFEPATGSGSLEDIITKIFKKSGESLYFAEKMMFSGDFSSLFLSPTHLKSLRNDFFQALEQQWFVDVKKKIARVLSEEQLPSSSLRDEQVAFFSRRLNCNPTTPSLEKYEKKIPYAFKEHLEDSTLLAQFEGFLIVPLLPLLPSPDEYKKALSTLLDQRDKRFLIGISNLAHIEMVSHFPQENIEYFLDFPIYLANRAAWKSFTHLLPKPPLFGYHWVEDFMQREWEKSYPLITNSEKSDIPLFNAVGCLEKSLNNDSCYANCPLHFSRTFSNNGREYVALTYSCVTMTFFN
ncbi:U32 family peptidase [bacterium]|nr:U32 family peptidase [bacterium]